MAISKEEAAKLGWKVAEDGTMLKDVGATGGEINTVRRRKQMKKEEIERKDEPEVVQERREPQSRPTEESEQVPTDYWIGRTHSGKDLILVLKQISKDESGNSIDRVFLANPRDVRDVINGDWSGARLRELRRVPK